MPLTQTQIMTDLSYLLGEQTVPTENVSDRQAFIQRTIDEVYRAFPWPQAMTTATLTVTSGAATLASNYYPQGTLDVREVLSGSEDDRVYDEVSYGQHDDYIEGDYKYWLSGGDPNYVIETKDDVSTLTARYQTKAPQVNASITIPFEDPMLFALGALRYVRIGENPEADITQEEDNFQVKLDQAIGLANRNKPRHKRRTLSSENDYFTGAV